MARLNEKTSWPENITSTLSEAGGGRDEATPILGNWVICGKMRLMRTRSELNGKAKGKRRRERRVVIANIEAYFRVEFSWYLIYDRPDVYVMMYVWYETSSVCNARSLVVFKHIFT